MGDTGGKKLSPSSASCDAPSPRRSERARGESGLRFDNAAARWHQQQVYPIYGLQPCSATWNLPSHMSGRGHRVGPPLGGIRRSSRRFRGAHRGAASRDGPHFRWVEHRPVRRRFAVAFAAAHFAVQQHPHVIPLGEAGPSVGSLTATGGGGHAAPASRLQAVEPPGTRRTTYTWADRPLRLIRLSADFSTQPARSNSQRRAAAV
jgi:hypothetical protein